MARADDLREYVRRDWALLGQAKQDFWIERRRRIPAVEALRIGDELRRQVHAVRPDWPTAAARATDLADHVRLAEILDRVAATPKR